MKKTNIKAARAMKTRQEVKEKMFEEGLFAERDRLYDTLKDEMMALQLENTKLKCENYFFLKRNYGKKLTPQELKRYGQPVKYRMEQVVM